jgi:hypothetical protein
MKSVSITQEECECGSKEFGIEKIKEETSWYIDEEGKENKVISFNVYCKNCLKQFNPYYL